jgi:hypothetical protein
LDRAEAKDYRDIAAMLARGTSLERALAAFTKMYRTDPAIPLRAMGFFKDGDLPSLSNAEQDLLRAARDHVRVVSDIDLRAGLLPPDGT